MKYLTINWLLFFSLHEQNFEEEKTTPKIHLSIIIISGMPNERIFSTRIEIVRFCF